MIYVLTMLILRVVKILNFLNFMWSIRFTMLRKSKLERGKIRKTEPAFTGSFMRCIMKIMFRKSLIHLPNQLKFLSVPQLNLFVVVRLFFVARQVESFPTKDISDVTCHIVIVSTNVRRRL